MALDVLTTGTLTLAASATAVVSEPPRPSVVMLPSASTIFRGISSSTSLGRPIVGGWSLLEVIRLNAELLFSKK